MKRISLDRTSGRVIRGDDVEITLNLSSGEAALGTRRSVRAGDDSIIDVPIPAGVEAGSTLCLQGKGLPSHSGAGTAGNLYLVFGVLPDLPRVQRKTYAWSSAFHPRLLGVIFTLVGLVLGDFVLSPILAAEQRKVVISTSLTLTVLFPYFMTLGPLFVLFPDRMALLLGDRQRPTRFGLIASAVLVGAGGALYALIQHKLAALGYSEHW